MHHYGIIGYPLLHSFSAKYFNEKFKTEHIDAEYSLYPMDKGEWSNGERLKELLNTLDGFNVTLPYKQAVIPFLDRLDETAQAIGAVNVVYQRVGYNTDCLGFMDSIRPLLRETDRKALVLGTGGASKAAYYGLRKLGVTPTLVSRHPQEGMLGYNDLTEAVLNEYTVIVNCTPLGTAGLHENELPPLPYQALTSHHHLYDLVYNPAVTPFLQQGIEHGCRIQNGMAMLHAQAVLAWQWFKGKMTKVE